MRKNNAVSGVEAVFYFRQLIFFSFFGFAACKILVPCPRLNPYPLHWKYRVLTTGLPGKFQKVFDKGFQEGAEENLEESCDT